MLREINCKRNDLTSLGKIETKKHFRGTVLHIEKAVILNVALELFCNVEKTDVAWSVR